MENKSIGKKIAKLVGTGALLYGVCSCLNFMGRTEAESKRLRRPPRNNFR